MDGLLFLFLKNELNLKKFFFIEKFLKEFILPEFPLNGHDILDIDIESKQVGIALKNAKKFWLENNFQCEKSQLLNYLKNLYSTNNSKK
jgi:hypothetical protein